MLKYLKTNKYALNGLKSKVSRLSIRIYSDPSEVSHPESMINYSLALEKLYSITSWNKLVIMI